jgi:transglutaminase/protease-like cytokinesis protein 3
MAQQILDSDTSGEPDYIVLIRWVYNNMVYDINYAGRSMSIDDILINLIGVCEHFTRLYNSLLQSIGINAIYSTGYGFNKKSALNYPDNSRYAWTVAQINDKWIPLDATWGIFDGKLPLSHVFESYEKNGISWRYTRSCSFSKEHKLEYLGYESSNSNVNLL